MKEVLLQHDDAISGTLQWTWSSLPYKINWYSVHLTDALCLLALPSLSNQRCICTYDGIRRQLASGFLELWLKSVALCWVFCQHSCHLVSLWHCNQHCCPWEFSASQDCLVLAFWWATWLLWDWIQDKSIYPGAWGHNLRYSCPRYLLNPFHHPMVYRPLEHCPLLR